MKCLTQWNLFVFLHVVFLSFLIYNNRILFIVLQQQAQPSVVDCDSSNASSRWENATVRLLGSIQENWGNRPHTVRHDDAIVRCPHDGRSVRKMKKKRPSSSVMVLASVPWDERHLVALWSELECFTKGLDHVVIASPSWGKPIIHRLLDQVQQTIPHFSESYRQRVTIDATFPIKNDRYDVGLWCDALTEGRLYERFDDVVLLNDSIFALRDYNSVLESLQHNNSLSMTSLSYSVNDDGVWLESIYRAFSTTGLTRFMNHSCVPKDHPSFCGTARNGRKKKRCITLHHEVGMARQFPSSHQVAGLFPAQVPDSLKRPNDFPTWVLHVPYWKQVLVEQMNFPAAKVNVQEMIPSTDDPLLKNCTRFLDRAWLREFNFSVARRSINY